MTEVGNEIQNRSAFLARLLGLLVFGSAAVWLAWIAPVMGTAATIDLSIVSEGLVRGEEYTPEFLENVDLQNAGVLEQKICAPQDLTNLTMLRLERATHAFDQPDAEVADERLKALTAAARKLIWCDPNSSNAWTVLAWEEMVRNDRTERLFDLLSMSYMTGPNEGWPMSRRMGLLYQLYPDMPPRLVDQLRQHVSMALANGMHSLLARLYLVGDGEQKEFLRAIFLSASRLDQRELSSQARGLGGTIQLDGALQNPRFNRR